MARRPEWYSRPLVLGGLGALLVLDVAVGLQAAVFVGGGVLVLLTAAGVHFYCRESRAGAGWLAFAAALALFAAVDVATRLSALVAVVVMLAGGLLLLGSRRREARE